MKNIPYIFVILVLILTSSNSLAQTSDNMEVQRLQDRINTLEKNIADMQKELYRSGKSKSKSSDGAPEPLMTNEERERALHGKFEEIEHSVSTLAAKLDKIIADIDFRIAALEKKVNALPEAVATPAVPAPTAAAATVSEEAKADGDVEGIETGKAAQATTEALVAAHDATGAATPPAAPAAAKPAAKAASPAKIAYDKAYEFIRLSKYDEAEKAFKDFIATNKGSDLVGNAYYWLGESYYSRQNYSSGAVNFLKGYQDFPKGNKAPDSLFKLGLSLKGMKKEKEACATFAKMKKEYPAADKALLAKVDAERKELKCK